MNVSSVIEHFAIGTCALTGVLAARGKGLDLFGVLVLAVVTAFGGGTLRDILVGDVPVAWLKDPSFLYTALVAGLVSFFITRVWQPPARLLDIVDAFSLALFSMVGARKGLALGFASSVAVMLGVMTGVAGGIVRDALVGRVPVVFRRDTYFYATAAATGSVVYAVLLRGAGWGINQAEFCGIATCLGLRLAALRWRLALPTMDRTP
ncbi:MAG: trimeric intracellular cation channel family protein [Verrucomicrobia bacterium]|nr:trimeric intracellular cation channel family protein [Verrucomicrobiota bacterium]